jgi:uncharacterized protein (DUF1330 family)
MKSTWFEITSAQREVLQQAKQGGRVALVYHLQVRDNAAYDNWLQKSIDLLESMAGSRLFMISVDPAPREGMLVDEIIIDEYPSTGTALKFVAAIQADLSDCCHFVTVLAIQPEPPLKLRVVRIIAWLMHFLRGIHDSGIPTANWKAENTAVWPDDRQMAVAREQDLDRPLLVYNLNKNRKVAQYPDVLPGSQTCSGEEAYERYSKIAGAQMLRRGAYPVYGGKPLGLLIGGDDSMLADNWSKFNLVYYPQRRNLLAMIESDEFKSGCHHRDAGLERVAIFMGNDKRAVAAE